MSNPPLSGSAERSCPYQGLVPYQEQDADYFFGRQNETDIIVANCLTTRVTLLYGASGVGKSSILYAGVAPAIKKRALENLRELNCAECVIVCFGSWRDDPVAGLQQRVDSTLREILPAARAMDAPESKPSLVETLRAWTSVLQSDVVLVLDQFEEHFLYRAVHDNSFGDQLVAVLNDPDLRVNVLISLREDRVAQLDAFKSTIPGLFDNSLRLEHLTEEAARAAIEGPLALFNSRFRADAVPITVEPPLVDAVLDEVRAGRVRVREAGQGELKAVESTRPDSMRVEAPYLQMVMMRMWREEVVPGKTSLTLAAFKRLGGAQEIVRTHLDAVMNKLSAKDRVLAARVFHQLVTPGGTKIAHFVNDLAQYVGGSPGAIQKMFDALDQPESRVLRDVSPPDAPSKRYEIFHDLLAAPVLDWRRREVVAEQQARTRRWLWLACFVLVVAGVVVAWKIVQREKALAEQNDRKLAAQRSEAENRAKADEQKIAKTQELVVAERKSKIEGVDLEKKALESVKNKDEQFTNVPIPMVPGDDDQPPPADSSNALLFETDKLFVHKGSVWTASYGSAQFVAAGKLNSFVITASRDKTAGIWDLKGDKDFFLRGHTGEVNHALFNPSPHSDGTGWLAATASDDNTAAIWRWSDGAKPTFLKGHSGPVS
ncbi:MAG TPA: hypothetical protein VJS88_08480, partial [Chthoniobacterales bacterium]|nr:hypothetical protein [Chthoniobacterales bacterium]